MKKESICKALENRYVKIGISIVTIVFAILFLLIFAGDAKKVYGDRFNTKLKYPHEAKIVEVIDNFQEVDMYGEECDCYIYRCKVIKGFEDTELEEITVVQKIEKIYSYRYAKAKVGNRIYVSEATSWSQTEKYPDIKWEFSGASTGYNRIVPLIILLVVFVISIILFSRLQGVNTLIALGLSLAAVFIILIPKILLGKNIYVYTLVSFLFVVGVTLILVIGLNKKALCALIGCTGGVLVITVITLIIKGAFSLTGYYDETTVELYIYTVDMFDIKLDLTALIFSMITLGSMGALLDVGISLSSSLYEVSQKAENAKEIVKSGFAIGKDMLGTMTNTLILAYLGTSLPLITFDIIYYTMEGMMRLEVLYIELIQSIVGTLGMLSAIPITSLVSGFIYKKKKGIEELGVKES